MKQIKKLLIQFIRKGGITGFKEKIKEIEKNDKNNKKKIENIVFLIVLLVITIIIINSILKKEDNSSTEEDNNNVTSQKTLAEITEDGTSSLSDGLESILSTIKGVGDVKVFINYSESSSTEAMYDETTTTSATEETDSSGGIRNVTSTETQREVIYSEEDGNKEPVTQKKIMPTIEGAIITAKGASNATVKSNIISAVEAATGLTIDKIQVFEMN